jgi:hypothetical protein
MKNYCDICFKCNDTEMCYTCEQLDDCVKFKECFGYIPGKMWGAMASFDDILRCVEKWRLYNEQITKQ